MLTAQMNMTPDGFCNHDAVIADDAFLHFAADLVEAADTVLLGRKTFDLFVAHWPDAARDDATQPAERRLAQAIDTTPRLVASRSLGGSDWPGTQIIADLDAPALADATSRGDVLLLGSPSLFDQMAARGALDRIILTVHPMLAGRGHRLLAQSTLDPALYRAGEARQFASGTCSFEFLRH